MNSAKLKLLVGGVLMAGGMGYMAWLSAQQTGQYALGVAEYLHAASTYEGHGLRIGGLVPKGSWHATGNHHSFTLVDNKDLATIVPVRFEGTMPDTFKEENMVIVAGKVGPDGTLVASEVIPQCASKYVPAPGTAAEQYKKYDHARDGQEMPARPGFGAALAPGKATR